MGCHVHAYTHQQMSDNIIHNEAELQKIALICLPYAKHAHMSTYGSADAQ